MMPILKKSLISVAACLGPIMADAVKADSPELLFQGIVTRNAVEAMPNAQWLFKRPPGTSSKPPYFIYQSEKILKLVPGDSFLGRIDLDIPTGPHGIYRFIVLWEETTGQSFRSLHGEIQSQVPDEGKIGRFRFTSKLGGSEITGCILIGDKDKCFIGKYDVGWMD